MKIKVEPKGRYKAVQCLEENCPWNRECSNHETAGDFRSEDGFTPILALRNGEVHCQTIHSTGDGEEFREYPLDIAGLGLLCWDDLVEETNTYEI
jgi:hypothetical protein